MTQSEIRERDVLARLARLAGVDVPPTAPWPTVQTAVRRSRRRRIVAGTTAVLATAAVLVLAVPLVLPSEGGTTPAAPGDGARERERGWNPGSTSGRIGMTFDDLYLEVEFDVSVLSNSLLPAGEGECVFIDHPDLVASSVGDQPVPDLSAEAAAGCRGGIVGQPLTAAVDPQLPFAGQPVSADVEPCVLVDSGRVTTRGLLLAEHSRFDCANGSLAQWVFDEMLIWSLDGGPRVVDVVQTAEIDVPR
ncbi:MAG: hypothetical protein M3513_16485 [Actinomycetota bacterium]|nr:hypothetical protein [Actinomycetota bacterium]